LAGCEGTGFTISFSEKEYSLWSAPFLLQEEFCFLLLHAFLKSFFWLGCLRQLSMIFLHLL
jgi:hypothetical protein